MLAIARRLAPPLFVTFAAVLPAAAAAQDAPLERLSCGAYEAVPAGFESAGKATRLTVQRKGRLLLSLTDWRITATGCEDLDGDRVPELVVRTFSGGAHCCETVRVYDLGKMPRLLLVYEGNNAIGVAVRDIDGDGRRELVLGDDTFAYFDDLCFACSPTPLPLVACTADGRVQDCTAKFPGLLRAERGRYLSRLKDRPPGETFQDTAGNALGVVALSALLGEEEVGLDLVRAAVADPRLEAWLAKATPHVRDWLGARGKKLRDGQQ